MGTSLSEVLFFTFFRTETATPTVPSPANVIALDIIKHNFPHYFPTDKVFTVEIFHFQRMKETFHAGGSISLLRSYCHADYAASASPDNLLNSTDLHGSCER